MTRTGVAALKNGREFIGIDINPDYAAIARNRIISTKYDNMTETEIMRREN